MHQEDDITGSDLLLTTVGITTHANSVLQFYVFPIF